MVNKILAAGILLLVFSGCGFYDRYFTPNVIVTDTTEACIYIRSRDGFEEVLQTLGASGYVKDTSSFRKVAEQMGYPEKIKPGKYVLESGMTNPDLVKLLASGRQVPVKVAFHFVRNVEELAGKVSRKIEADSSEIVALMRDESWTMSELRLNVQYAPVIFLPNTYEFYWATDAEAFIRKMKKEYDKFWNEERQEKARALGLKPEEVSVLASIVQSEQMRIESEWPTIAGLYLNRLKIGMKLQADPTVKFALGDWSLRRVYESHTKVNSPYNTYLYAGLPPGPIYIPEPKAIDAVLNAEKHNYIYMCAHSDMSGRHVFTHLFEEHLRNANQFQKALNRAGIR